MNFHVYLRPFPKSLSQTSRRRALGDSEIFEAVALLLRLMIRLRLKPKQLTEKEFNKIHCGLHAVSTPHRQITRPVALEEPNARNESRRRYQAIGPPD
jgi:hypothetical protein